MGSNNPKGCNLRVLKMLNYTAGNTRGGKRKYRRAKSPQDLGNMSNGITAESD